MFATQKHRMRAIYLPSREWYMFFGKKMHLTVTSSFPSSSLFEALKIFQKRFRRNHLQINWLGVPTSVLKDKLYSHLLVAVFFFSFRFYILCVHCERLNASSKTILQNDFCSSSRWFSYCAFFLGEKQFLLFFNLLLR